MCRRRGSEALSGQSSLSPTQVTIGPRAVSPIVLNELEIQKFTEVIGLTGAQQLHSSKLTCHRRSVLNNTRQRAFSQKPLTDDSRFCRCCMQRLVAIPGGFYQDVLARPFSR